MKRYDKRSYDTRAAIGLSLQPLILCLSFYTYAVCESSTFSTYTLYYSYVFIYYSKFRGLASFNSLNDRYF